MKKRSILSIFLISCMLSISACGTAENAEPGMSGSLKTACSISDALVLQYYEEPDTKAAAFGNDLKEGQWEDISEIKDVYVDVLFGAPLIAANVALFCADMIPMWKACWPRWMSRNIVCRIRLKKRRRLAANLCSLSTVGRMKKNICP